MDMQTTLRSISIVLMLIVFSSFIVWVFLPRRKDSFKDAANAPFADDEEENLIDNNKVNGSEKHNE